MLPVSNPKSKAYFLLNPPFEGLMVAGIIPFWLQRMKLKLESGWLPGLDYSVFWVSLSFDFCFLIPEAGRWALLSDALLSNRLFELFSMNIVFYLKSFLRSLLFSTSINLII